MSINKIYCQFYYIRSDPASWVTTPISRWTLVHHICAMVSSPASIQFACDHSPLRHNLSAAAAVTNAFTCYPKRAPYTNNQSRMLQMPLCTLRDSVQRLSISLIKHNVWSCVWYLFTRMSIQFATSWYRVRFAPSTLRRRRQKTDTKTQRMCLMRPDWVRVQRVVLEYATQSSHDTVLIARGVWFVQLPAHTPVCRAHGHRLFAAIASYRIPGRHNTFARARVSKN